MPVEVVPGQSFVTRYTLQGPFGHFRTGRRQSKKVLTIDKRGSKTDGNKVFD